MKKFEATVSITVVAIGGLGLSSLSSTPRPPLAEITQVRTPLPYLVTGLWDTHKYDKTAYQPTTASPITELSEKWQLIMACVRYNESRNHPTSVSYAGAGGLYQIMPNIWRAYGGRFYAPNAQSATPVQQDAVAVKIIKTNGGLYPEWGLDAC